MNKAAEAIERSAVRAILLTPERDVLLMQLRESPAAEAFWVTPGGGVQPGEDDEAALRRELQEELGLNGFAIGPMLLRRDHTFNWLGRRIRQRERLYLVETARFEPLMSDAVEPRVTAGFRWWTLGELRATAESVTPRRLAGIIQGWLHEGRTGEDNQPDVVAG
jgi:8-oxo-dGTP pyrophosphatase MutT (NUDIX family)